MTTDSGASDIAAPEDAGEHAEALRGILARIPDGWGRWISCGRGWYPLIVELDEQLRVLFPTYAVHQVKEKFGGLRYYWDAEEDVGNPARMKLAEKLVCATESRAAVTCELCGASGRLHRTPAPFHRYQTLCPTCAEQLGYVPAASE
jgi:hypothetical protein